MTHSLADESEVIADVPKKHPKGLYLLFFVEMWERFSYYGMRALLVLYMVDAGALAFSVEKAGKIYGLYTGLVYFTPLIGGYIADKYLGQRACIFIGAVIMAIGHFVMAFEPLPFFYTALGLIIIGNGFFKPNISTTVGQLYEQNDPRRDGAYTIFYMGINLGAFMSPFICGTLGEKVGWHYGFAAAGVGMVIGLIIYMWGGNKYLGDIGKKPKEGSERAIHSKDPLTTEEKQRLVVICVLTFFSVFFWAAFEQAGSSLALFAKSETNRMIFGWEVPASFFQALNPLFIMIFAPIMAMLWSYLGRRKMDPSAPLKFVFALTLLGTGFIVMALAAKVYIAAGPVSVFWLVAVFWFHTIGELCLSPVGLSMVTKLSPVKFVSMMMGIWLGSSMLGNFMGGGFASRYEMMSHDLFFLVPAATAFISATVLFIFRKKLKAWMHGIH